MCTQRATFWLPRSAHSWPGSSHTTGTQAPGEDANAVLSPGFLHHSRASTCGNWRRAADGAGMKFNSSMLHGKKCPEAKDIGPCPTEQSTPLQLKKRSTGLNSAQLQSSPGKGCEGEDKGHGGCTHREQAGAVRVGTCGRGRRRKEHH